jgi:TfoX/Sxy family transcriptional regulator of competence genes
MVPDQNTVAYICDQIRDPGRITHRTMFGDYGL